MFAPRRYKVSDLDPKPLDFITKRGYNALKMDDIAVVIVSFNVAKLLRDCLQSVYGNEDVSLRVYVVDNGSTDNSVSMVKAEFPQAKLIESLTNGGYAYGNNLALRPLLDSHMLASTHPVPCKYILLLNPDTVVPPHALKNMLDFMESRPDVGAAGPKLVRGDGCLDFACRRSFPTPEVSLYRMLGLSKLFPKSRRFARYNLTYLNPEYMTEVDSVAGAFMMVRWQAFVEVGLLDETFFMYGEDLDWAYRIKEKGWKVMYYPQVTVLHHKGKSSRQYRYKTTIEFYRAMLIFYHKHYSKQSFFLMHWLIVAAIYLRAAIAYLPRFLPIKELGRVS